MSNVLSFVGNLGQDAVIRQAGKANVLSFSVAMSSGFGDRAATTWVNCSVWGVRATDKMAAALPKGTKVFLSGEMSLNEYDKKDGSGKATSVNLNVSLLEFAGSKPATDSVAPQAKPAPKTIEKDQVDDVPF